MGYTACSKCTNCIRIHEPGPSTNRQLDDDDDDDDDDDEDDAKREGKELSGARKIATRP